MKLFDLVFVKSCAHDCALFFPLQICQILDWMKWCHFNIIDPSIVLLLFTLSWYRRLGENFLLKKFFLSSLVVSNLLECDTLNYRNSSHMYAVCQFVTRIAFVERTNLMQLLPSKLVPFKVQNRRHKMWIIILKHLIVVVVVVPFFKSNAFGVTFKNMEPIVEDRWWMKSSKKV